MLAAVVITATLTSGGEAAAAASQEDYSDQSPAEALDTARSEFGDFVDNPFWQSLRLLSGERVAGYEGEFAALIDPPVGPNQLVGSTRRARRQLMTTRPAASFSARRTSESVPRAAAQAQTHASSTTRRSSRTSASAPTAI
jgi:hypothetical protein